MLPDRFWSKVMVVGDCWLWTAATTPKGYGRYGNGYAHRVSYEDRYGPILKGLQIDHLCRVRNCVNPEHLEAVTMQENLRRGVRNNGQAAKTHCKRGHPFDGANTYRSAKQRHCRACSALRMRRYRAA